MIEPSNWLKKVDICSGLFGGSKRNMKRTASSTKQHLTQLEATGLLRLAQTHPELEYLFRHALVQDAAYRSLLRGDRKRLHRQVGETIERLYPHRLADWAAGLGQHFILAGDDHRALKYFTLAGDTAAAGYANAEAATHYQQALELAQRLNADAVQLLQLFIQLGRVLELNTQYEPALHNYEQMEALARQRHDPTMQLAALMARSTLYVTFTPVHDPIQAEELLDTALALARDLDDQIAESKILWNMADLYMFPRLGGFNPVRRALGGAGASIKAAGATGLFPQRHWSGIPVHLPGR